MNKSYTVEYKMRNIKVGLYITTGLDRAPRHEVGGKNIKLKLIV